MSECGQLKLTEENNFFLLSFVQRILTLMFISTSSLDVCLTLKVFSALSVRSFRKERLSSRLSGQRELSRSNELELERKRKPCTKVVSEKNKKRKISSVREKFSRKAMKKVLERKNSWQRGEKRRENRKNM